MVFWAGLTKGLFPSSRNPAMVSTDATRGCGKVNDFYLPVKEEECLWQDIAVSIC